MKRTLLIATALVSASIAFVAAKEWKAPARAAAKKNPIPADRSSIARGKAVYFAECATCHGNRGKGDGPGARDLEVSPGNLTRLGGQSDGALFWKITNGKKPMASN